MLSELFHFLASYFGHFSYLCTLLSFTVRKIFLLRLLAIFSSLLSVVYNFYFLAQPSRISVQWNCIFISINIFHLIVLVLEKRKVQFKGHEKFLFEKVFMNLTPVQFKKILNLAKLHKIPQGTSLIREGTHLHDLFAVVSGKLDVKSQSFCIAQLEPGSFAGEMSFLTNDKTRADVVSAEETTYYSWNQKTLKNLLMKKPELLASFQRVLGSQIITALMKRSLEQNQSPPIGRTTEHAQFVS